MSCVCSVRGSAFSSSQESETGFSTSPETLERPGGEVGRRDRARVQDGPLLGQVLARRQASGVVAGFAHLLFRLGAEHVSTVTTTMRDRDTAPASFVRVAGPRRRGVPRPDGLERRRGARPGRVVRGAAADAEGARDRAARRAAARPRGLPAPDRARARRARAGRAASASRFAAKAEIELEEHTSPRRLRRQPRGASRPPTTASRRWRCSTRSVEPSDRARGARAPPHPRRARRAGGRRSTTGCCPPRPGLTERAVSFTKGCYPGQEPIARLHYRGHANRGLRVLDA